MPRNRLIGIFDSGFGGLNTMKNIVRYLPEYDFIYLGDTARAPYGNRSQEMIYKFTCQAVDFLVAKKCGLIILACNTASSEALRKIQKKYLPKKYPEKKVLGVLVPTAEAAVEETTSEKIGVIATHNTVKSDAFSREIKKLDSRAKVFQKACPMLVPLVEAGEHKTDAAENILRGYLSPLLKKNIDTLILGCTHYGILEKQIREIVGPNINIVSEAKIIGQKFKEYLARHPEIEKNLGKNKSRIFYSTDLTDNFQKLGSQFFGRKIETRKIFLK